MRSDGTQQQKDPHPGGAEVWPLVISDLMRRCREGGYLDERIWSAIIEDARQRDLAGRERYGTPLQVGNGRDALLDAYQESLDLLVYLRQDLAGTMPSGERRLLYRAYCHAQEVVVDLKTALLMQRTRLRDNP